MSQSLRICVADDEVDMRDYLKKILPRLGHEVVAAAENGRQLVEDCQRLKPDLVITDIKMEEMDGITAAIEINQQDPTPVILISAFHDHQLIERAEQDHVLAYLVKPIKQADLQTAIILATRRFGEFCALRNEAADLRQTLEHRKIIERAKGVLMKQSGLGEADAFRRMQRMSNDTNRKMVDVAREILAVDADTPT